VSLQNLEHGFLLKTTDKDKLDDKVIQNITDKHIERIDILVANKIKEL
jgi:ribosome recycling factor